MSIKTEKGREEETEKGKWRGGTGSAKYKEAKVAFMPPDHDHFYFFLHGH